MTTQEILLQAKKEKTALAVLSGADKDRILLKMADALVRDTEEILEANAADVEAARGRISDVMIDRLKLTGARISDMAEGIRAVAKLPDPVGKVLEDKTAENGLRIRKLSVPMGVIAIIYESRPNVTSDAAALSLKSGNVCVLRSGKEAFRSAQAIVKAMRKGIREAGYPETFINIIEDTGRESAVELMKARGLIDLLIPRGGAGLIRACVEQASVPVIETGTGICTVYVDEAADLEKALAILDNAKTQRPSVCNAAEQLLVHEKIAAAFLPEVRALLVRKREEAGKIPVELKLSEKAAQYISGTPAAEADFDTEFLDYILAVDVVRNVQEAAAHIEAHSTHHSEAIVTENTEAADYFVTHIDSAALYVNASTRFTDGRCFGLGCEMGISTQKLHARGPMGLSELCSYKYVITGNGQVRN